jgi:hypothetical protein
MFFGVPICRAEQRRVDGSSRPSAVRVPQQATSCVACQGEFRWTPGKPSSARKKRKLGCTFFWLLVLWASKEKYLAYRRKTMSPKPTKQKIRRMTFLSNVHSSDTGYVDSIYVGNLCIICANNALSSQPFNQARNCG